MLPDKTSDSPAASPCGHRSPPAVVWLQAHRLSHAAAVMATFDTLAILTCAVVAANPDCTEPLGMSVAAGWFFAHLVLSAALLAVATAHFTLRAAVADLTFLTPHLYAAAASCFTGLAFGSLLQLPLAGVLSGQFVTAAWAGGAGGGVAPVGAGDAAVGGSRFGPWGLLRRVGTLAGVAAALLGVFNGAAFLLLNGFSIVRAPPCNELACCAFNDPQSDNDPLSTTSPG